MSTAQIPLPPAAQASPELRTSQFGNSAGTNGRSSARRRFVKLTLALLVAGSGAYGLFSEQYTVSSRAAIVTAYLTTIRSPIEGELHGLPTSAGGFAAPGAILARVTDPRANQDRLEDMEQDAAIAEKTVQALKFEQRRLLTLRGDLASRANLHVQGVAARLEEGLSEESAEVSAREAAALKTHGALARARALFADGIISAEALDAAATEDTMAAARAAASRARFREVRLESTAARAGVLTEAGVNNDVAYSRQRIDEVNLRLAEHARMLLLAEESREESGRRLEQQRVHTALMQSAVLRAPARVMVWRLNASNGEHVAAGDALADVVPCDQHLLLAAIPQNRVPDIDVGGRALVRLSGEAGVHTGRIDLVSADPLISDNRKLAILPLKNTEAQMATVRVQLDPDSSDRAACPVGRTASVTLETRGGTSRLFRWLERYH